jgi:hypothetical protein
MTEGQIKRNTCDVCHKPNHVDDTACKHCGGACSKKVIGVAKTDDEQVQPENFTSTRSRDSIIPL